MSNRFAIISLATLACLIKKLIPLLLPFGPAYHVSEEDVLKCAPLNVSNDSLRAKHGKFRKIVERVPSQEPDKYEKLLQGSETVVFDNEGTLYALSEHGNLVSLTDFVDDPKNPMIITAKATLVADIGIGRPLGSKFVTSSQQQQQGKMMYYADAVMGLMRVRFPVVDDDNSSSRPVVELVASKVKDSDQQWTKIAFADDLDIGPKSGNVYFSDASDIRPGTGEGGTLRASILDSLRGKKSGRLLRYNPNTDQVDILLDNVWFANGVAVDKDETFVLLVETFSARVLKYNLEDGTVEVVEGLLPGIPDGVDCSSHTDKCYVALPSKEVPIFAIFRWPDKLSRFIREFISILPPSLGPKPEPYAGFGEITLDKNDNRWKVSRIIQDPNGEDMEMSTGVTEHNGKLYLGTLDNDYVGVYDLN